MLNFEQILIKAAQYFELDLKKLQLQQTAQKRRFFTRENTKEKYDEVLIDLLKEIDDIELHKEVEQIINEFLDYYEYIEKEIYTNYKKAYVKQYDWLVLKYFVVPFFAVRMSSLFLDYQSRIDHGLPGGLFWYLPMSDGEKIIFPVNTLIKWWIDLYGSSNEDFYYDSNASDDQESTVENISIETDDLEKRHNTLKNWRYGSDIPDIRSIIKYTAWDLNYKGVFTSDKETIEEQYLDALFFTRNIKKLSLNDLKNEIPNPDNLLDRLDTDLTLKEQEKFVDYIQKRWAKPTKSQLKSLLTIARISQLVFKDIGNYFNSKFKEPQVHKNCSYQLSLLFSELYNFNGYLCQGKQPEERYGLYKNYFDFCYDDIDKKELLDVIIAKVSREAIHPSSNYIVDEIIVVSTKDKALRLKSLEKLKVNEKNNKRPLTGEGVDSYISKIADISDVGMLSKILHNANDQELHNLAEYYSGHNHLTNDKPIIRHDVSLEIYRILYEKASTGLYKSIATLGVINLATFPFYPRYLKKVEVDEWFEKNASCDYEDDDREKLIMITKKAFHEIIQNNLQASVPMIIEVMNKTKSMKNEEYNPELLCIGEIIAKLLHNRTLERKLKKANKHHQLMRDHYQQLFSQLKKFYYY